MEFGLFLGGFVHHDVAAANPNAEHDRLMSEVALCETADRHNWKYAWFTEHHFLKEYSHISASETLDGVGARPHASTSTSRRGSSTSRRR